MERIFIISPSPIPGEGWMQKVLRNNGNGWECLNQAASWTDQEFEPTRDTPSTLIARGYREI